MKAKEICADFANRITQIYAGWIWKNGEGGEKIILDNAHNIGIEIDHYFWRIIYNNYGEISECIINIPASSLGK